jgi:hypothetical protein
MDKLTVFINNEIVFEFDRGLTFSDQQLAFLHRMDSDMDKGIKIQGQLLVNPDARQRATFVAMNLIKALQQDNEAAKTSSCAYLVNHLPALVEVHAIDDENAVKIELIEE